MSAFNAPAALQDFRGSVSRSHQPGCASAWSWHLEDPRNGASKQYFAWFNFKPWTGRVTIEPDGFHWSTTSYDDGSLLLSGVTDSLYEAWQSVVQNKTVRAVRCATCNEPLMLAYGGPTSGQYEHRARKTDHDAQPVHPA